MKGIFFFFGISLAIANPTDPQVIAGDVRFEELSPQALQVFTSDLSIINWKEFSIGKEERTQFIQPNPHSAVLNRVTSGNPSELLGKLEANGHIYLINPNGVFIADSAVINTNSFIVQTFELADEKFLAHDFKSGPLYICPDPHMENPKNRFAAAIRHSGKISSMQFEEKGGHVYLLADRGTIEIDGQIDAPGGDVRILGEYITLNEQAKIDVSSDQGDGGIVRIGGDFQGENPSFFNAKQVSASPSAQIHANAAKLGDGGKIIIWSDEATQFHGLTEARGGSLKGDGGLIEISGKMHLDYRGVADTSAPFGRTGTLLLDPINIRITGANFNVTITSAPPFVYITPAALGATISTGTIDTNLMTSHVVVESSGALGSELGNVTLVSAFAYARANDLTLRTRNLTTVPPVTEGNVIIGANLTNAGTGSIIFDSVQDILHSGATVSTASGNISYLAARDIRLGDSAATVATNVAAGLAGNVLFDAGRDFIGMIGSGAAGDIRISTVNGALTFNVANDFTVESANPVNFFQAEVTGSGAGPRTLFVDIGRDLIGTPFGTTTFLLDDGLGTTFNVGRNWVAGINGAFEVLSQDSPGGAPLTIHVGLDFILGEFSTIQSTGGNTNSIINVGRNLIMHSSDLSNDAGLFLNVGQDLRADGPLSFISSIKPPSVIAVGNDIVLDNGAIFFSSFSVAPSTFFVSAGHDITFSGTASGFSNTFSIRRISLDFTAGHDFIINGTSRIRTLGTGAAITLRAGNRFSLQDSALITANSDVTLIADNKFPKPPYFGSGGLSKGSGATISTTTGAVRIFTAKQSQNAIFGSINGTPFFPGAEFVNTATEMWGIYFPHNSGFPFTIFYKNIFVPFALVQAFDLSVYEFLQNIQKFDRFYSLAKFFFLGYTQNPVGSDEQIEEPLPNATQYRMVERQFLNNDRQWFDPSFEGQE